MSDPLINDKHIDKVRDQLDADTEAAAYFDAIVASRSDLVARLETLDDVTAPDGKPIKPAEWEALRKICKIFTGSIDRAGGTDSDSSKELLEMEVVARRFGEDPGITPSST